MREAAELAEREREEGEERIKQEAAAEDEAVAAAVKAEEEELAKPQVRTAGGTRKG